jgi:hypothetical protein
LAFDGTAGAGARVRSLTVGEMKRVFGGRAISVLVDGRTAGTVDDFSLNMEIFKGNIGGPMVLSPWRPDAAVRPGPYGLPFRFHEDRDIKGTYFIAHVNLPPIEVPCTRPGSYIIRWSSNLLFHEIR